MRKAKGPHKKSRGLIACTYAITRIFKLRVKITISMEPMKIFLLHGMFLPSTQSMKIIPLTLQR